MALRRLRRGFTLIELMLVVAIIGLLAALAVPSFLQFQARSKQSEAKANLKALFTAERAFFQEQDRYTPLVFEAGFAPERGNRYAYRAGQGAAIEARSAATVDASSSSTWEGISVDTYRHPGTVADPLYVEGSAGLGEADTTDAAFSGTAAGNIDADTGVDSWHVSTYTSTVSAKCGNSATKQVDGEPFNSNNDVSCASN